MKQRKLLGTLAIALTLVLTACGGGGNGGSSKKATHKHEYGDWQTVTAATCTQGGTEKRVCKNSDGLCTKVEDTRTTSALGHQEPSPLVKEEEVPATCETAGSYKYTCARCGQKVQVDVPALQHDWEDAADQTGAEPATCTEAGTKIQVCKNDPTHTRTVDVPALGHDFDEQGTELVQPAATEKNYFGEDTYHWAKITNYSCKRNDSFRYAWSAKEVNFDYANVAEGAEPELLDDGDGIRFFGRPICNAMELNAQGDAANRGDTPKVPDPSVKGSRFEFDFEFDKDLEDVCLSAEFTPADYTSDVFKNADNTEDWTPGYKNVELDPDHPGVHYTAEEIAAAVEGDPAYGKTTDDWKEEPQYKGEIIKPFRFIIYLDGKEVVLDKNVSTPANGRGWYQFPCRLNLTKGKHNLNIAMAGGYRHVFYQFSFEKLAPAHEHKFGEGTAQTDPVESKVAQCKCGVEQIRWDANKFDATLSSSDVQKNQATGVSGDTNTGMKLNGDVYNKGSGSNQSTPATEASVGCHAVYKVNVPAAKTEAKLLIKGSRNSSSAVGMFSMQSGDQTKSWYEKTPGETWVRYPWRYKLLINDVEVPFEEYEDGAEPSTGSKVYVEAAFPCTFALRQGENKIELQKWGGYTFIITEMAFEY
jgi:hypothetical protein